MLCSSARANFGGYESGNAATGNVQPLAQKDDTFRPAGLAQVEMQSELLQIHLHIESADVEVDYTLHNPGSAPVTVTAGFPTLSQDVSTQDDPGDGMPRGSHDARDVMDYHLSVDGKETQWKLEPQPQLGKQDKGNGSGFPQAAYSTPEPFWFVSSVPFETGQTHAVRIRYRAQYRNAFGGVSDDDTVEPATLAYQLSTAAGWKGSIAKGRVIITADTTIADAIKIRPEGRFLRAGNAFTWEFSNLKPTLADDITVQVREGYERFATDMAISKDQPQGSKKDEYIGYYEVHDNGASYWINQRFHAANTSKAHGAENVADYQSRVGDPWSADSPGDGIGEGLDLILDRPSKLYQIGIINGSNRSEKSYRERNRVAELEVSINGGKEFIVAVPDEFLEEEPYWFTVPGRNEIVKTVRLRVRQVYHGLTEQNTCISKIYLKTKLAKEPKIGPIR